MGQLVGDLLLVSHISIKNAVQHLMNTTATNGRLGDGIEASDRQKGRQIQ